MFLRNAWYVAAWSGEVADAPLARTLLGEPVVLFRVEDGAPVALQDRCCHRQLPLSMGKVVGSEIQCGYHGLRFDAEGRCNHVPGQSAVPPGAGGRGPRAAASRAEGASPRARVPPVDYRDKLPPSPWDTFAPPRRYIFTPPLTPAGTPSLCGANRPPGLLLCLCCRAAPIVRAYSGAVGRVPDFGLSRTV